jgi:REP element-mobilizing transposase RayT
MGEVKLRSTGFQPVPQRNDAEEPDTGRMPVLQPFDPEADFEVRSRNLPHWRQEGATYFATFRLGDSLPREKLDALRAEREDWLRRHPPPRSVTLLQRFQALFSARIEEFLATGCGACWLRRAEMQDVVAGALRHFHGDRYSLGAYVIMPNHVHALVTPYVGWNLSDILHSWKSFTANQINRAVNRQGRLWQEETYDHIVRDAEELAACEQYIRDNPAKAALRDGEFSLGRA